ncbi:MAG: hypothetical protein LBL13_08730 [Bacteroidales bacterium]|nr:hypothetical protein [Bacteroidales bacterium]
MVQGTRNKVQGTRNKVQGINGRKDEWAKGRRGKKASKNLFSYLLSAGLLIH